jgi:hypothetical protein
MVAILLAFSFLLLNFREAIMSQIADSNENSPPDYDLTDDRIAELCTSLQFHLSEPAPEVHQMRWRAVSHPDTHPQVLHHIASLGSHHLAKRVAEHPRAESSTLSQLALHGHYEVRAALADNQNIPLQLQWQLAGDEHPDVRFALAECYHIDPNVLASLLDDDNPFVANRAKTTLQRKNIASSSPTKLPGSTEAGGISRHLRASG